MEECDDAGGAFTSDSQDTRSLAALRQPAHTFYNKVSVNHGSEVVGVYVAGA